MKIVRVFMLIVVFLSVTVSGFAASLFSTHLETGNLTDFLENWGCSVSTDYSHDGTHSLKCSQPGGELVEPSGQSIEPRGQLIEGPSFSTATAYMRAYVYIPNLSGPSGIIGLSQLGPAEVRLNVDGRGNGSISIWNGQTMLGSWHQFSAAKWHRVEFKIVYSASEGIIELKNDETTLETFTGIDTTGTTLTNVWLNAVNRGGGAPAVDVYYDDVEADDADYPGEW